MPIRMGNAAMAGPRRPTSLLRACVSTCAVFASSFGAVRAADVTNSQTAPPADAPDPFTGWYVKLGAMGVLDRSSSNLYQQSIAGMIVPGIGTVPVGVGPQLQVPGLGASYSNFAGVAVQGGYSFTPNWSVEVASGFPLWATVTINGSSPTGPPSGTVLNKLLPASVPITGVYHFTQFGRFQPYLGRALRRPSLWRPETATASAQHINPRSASSSKAASITCSTSTGASLLMRSRASWGRRGTRQASTRLRPWGRLPAR